MKITTEMKLKIGDKVRQMEHGMKGEVVRVRDDNTYDIKCSDGIERPGNDESYVLDPYWS